MLVALNPENGKLFLFSKGEFIPYEPILKKPETISNMKEIIENSVDNIPVYITQ